MKKITTLAVVSTVLLAASGAQGGIVMPDSDTFDVAGTPPPGWTKVSRDGWDGDWTVASGVANVVNTYQGAVIQRTPGTETSYTYDPLKKLICSWDMKPGLAHSTNDEFMGAEILTPTTANPFFGANNGVGYVVRFFHGGVVELRRDAGQWSVVPTTVASWDCSRDEYNDNVHSYRVEVTYQTGTTALWQVFVDDVERINYTDNQFMPMTGWSGDGAYTEFKAAIGTYTGGGGSFVVSGYADNWNLNVPEPATMGLLGLGFAGMAVLRRRRT